MSDIGSFDPSLLLGAQTSEANTRRPPIPAGQAVRGRLGAPKIRQAEGKKETNKGEVYTFLEIPVELDMNSNPGAKAAIGGLDMVPVTWSTRLDLAANNQGFDMSPGKNNGLRQLREATNLNNPGQIFSIPMVEGREVLCMIKNEKGQDDEIYDRIGSLAKIS